MIPECIKRPETRPGAFLAVEMGKENYNYGQKYG